MGADISKLTLPRKMYNATLDKLAQTEIYKQYRYHALNNKYLRSCNAFFDFFIKIRLKFFFLLVMYLNIKNRSSAYYQYINRSRYYLKRVYYLKIFMAMSFLALIGTIIPFWDRFIYSKLETDDWSKDFLKLFTEKDDAHFYTKRKIIEEGLKNGELDIISWIAHANLFKSDPEIAYHAYYIAHLKDHTNIQANSDLRIDQEVENEEKNQSEQEKTINKILNSL